MTLQNALVAAAISTTLASGAWQPSTEFDGLGYRVLLPSGVTAATDAKVDFDITTFKKSDGTVLLSAYSGLHPDFKDRGAREERINGMRAKRLTYTDPSKGRCAEVLVTLRSGAENSSSARTFGTAQRPTMTSGSLRL